MATPCHLHRVVVTVEIVGGLVEIAIAISSYPIIQRTVKLWISVSWVGRVCGRYRPERDQVDVAACAAAICQVPAPVSHIGDFHKALPGCSLRDCEAIAIGVRLPVVLGIDSCRGSRRGGDVDTREIRCKQMRPPRRIGGTTSSSDPGGQTEQYRHPASRYGFRHLPHQVARMTRNSIQSLQNG